MVGSSQPQVVESLFQQTLTWLGDTYGERVFYVERDIVYTVQTKLNELLAETRMPWMVYNDYPMIPGPRRALSADLAIVDSTSGVAVAVEFKYEPCHRRHDVLKSKLPVVVWADVVKDTLRVQEFVNTHKTTVAYAVCIDEGGYLARRDLSIYTGVKRWDASPRHDHPVTAFVYRYAPGM
jgi:hypothetical protein